MQEISLQDSIAWRFQFISLYLLEAIPEVRDHGCHLCCTWGLALTLAYGFVQCVCRDWRKLGCGLEVGVWDCAVLKVVLDQDICIHG